MARETIADAAMKAGKASARHTQKKLDISESLDMVDFASQKAAYEKEKWSNIETAVSDTLELVGTIGETMKGIGEFSEQITATQEIIAEKKFDPKKWGGMEWDEFKAKGGDRYKDYMKRFSPSMKLGFSGTEYQFGEEGEHGSYSKSVIAAAGSYRKKHQEYSELIPDYDPKTMDVESGLTSENPLNQSLNNIQNQALLNTSQGSVTSVPNEAVSDLIKNTNVQNIQQQQQEDLDDLDDIWKKDVKWEEIEEVTTEEY